LSLDLAVLTNLGRDHLDYHITPEAYRAAKERLFHWQTLKAVVLNADDEMGRDLIASIDSIPRFAYSTSAYPSAFATNTDLNAIIAEGIYAHDVGLEFDIVDAAFTGHLKTGLLGRFNVDNVLACYASLRACKIAANDALHALDAVRPVPGRMEQLGGAGKVTVVVDYSHTPGALSAVIDALRVHCKNRLWVVFGCGGDRDPGKRAPMAQAAQVADHVVLTDDNPRTESSAAIIKDAMAGFDNPENVHVIPDRSAAIHFAITSATSTDLVLIAGKGHENYQIIGNTRHHFSDREQTLAALELAS
jgi:UDP-N-acetylmuramoyl-L-alanyl-D-glutamate--2,6-diaminopimelate ligase